MGFELVYLKRKGSINDSLSGILDYTNLSKKATDFLLTKKADLFFGTLLNAIETKQNYCPLCDKKIF